MDISQVGAENWLIFAKQGLGYIDTPTTEPTTHWNHTRKRRLLNWKIAQSKLIYIIVSAHGTARRCHWVFLERNFPRETLDVRQHGAEQFAFVSFQFSSNIAREWDGNIMMVLVVEPAVFQFFSLLGSRKVFRFTLFACFFLCFLCSLTFLGENVVWKCSFLGERSITQGKIVKFVVH